MLKENIGLKIQESYLDLTDTEKEIADFFISNKEDVSFSAKDVACKLYVSEAALSRFSKKLDFNGYREFIYEYKLYLESNINKKDNLTMKILDTYKELLKDAYGSIDNEQMIRIANLISNYEKVHVFGIENASLITREFRVNFMKLGVNIQYSTDEDMMGISETLMDEDTLAIGFSMSVGDQADPGMEALIAAKNRGAKTIMITSNANTSLCEFCDELVRIPIKRNREIGHSICPKIPMLMMVEILFVHCLSLVCNETKVISIERIISIEDETI